MGLKRKFSVEDPPSDEIRRLLNMVTSDLAHISQDDPIYDCGPACLATMASRPEDVLELAHQKLHAWPYKTVPLCWRRLYEEASLWSVAAIIRHKAVDCSPRSTECERSDDPPWLTQVVKTLDMAAQLTGAPGRAQTIEMIFTILAEIAPKRPEAGLPMQFSINPPAELRTQCQIPRLSNPPAFEQFQAHLDRNNTPIIMEGALEHWPARIKWASPSYWMDRTLGGRRLVPVEVGAQYTDEGWSQQIMPFGDFMDKYLLANSNETGYLAQYDLFAQIPPLRSDVQIPDYCYCSPPRPEISHATDGELDNLEEPNEPLMNLWLGPGGTKTPLHTDPYSNILAQVVGYKYVRLYAPTETSKLYPMGIDDKGVDMSNTSSVDVSLSRLHQSGQGSETGRLQELQLQYPLFQGAEFVEGILGAGECLYIPQGWWHYVEGLTIGASVSFWWN